MTSILGMQSFVASGVAHSNPPDEMKQAIPQIADTADSGAATSQNGRDFPDQSKANTSSQSDDVSADLRRSPASPAPEPVVVVFSANMVTGPTPTFQASLMDLSSELRNEIAMAQAGQVFIPQEAPSSPLDIDVSDGTSSGAIISSDLSSPVERRDAQVLQPSSQDETASSENAVIEYHSQHAAVALQDPEAAYAGTSAIQVKPYDQLNIAV